MGEGVDGGSEEWMGLMLAGGGEERKQDARACR